MPQINYPKTNNRFITVTYQSNNYLNEELDNKVKQVIAKTIFDSVKVLNFHSYVHGQIIVEISKENVVTDLKKIVNALAEPMTTHALPPNKTLLYSVDLTSVLKGDDPVENLIFVCGDDEMNTSFLDSIKKFYPKKSE